MIKDTKPTETSEQIRELTEQELQLVAGGRKAGKDQQEYLIVTMQECLVSSV